MKTTILIHVASLSESLDCAVNMLSGFAFTGEPQVQGICKSFLDGRVHLIKIMRGHNKSALVVSAEF